METRYLIVNKKYKETPETVDPFTSYAVMCMTKTLEQAKERLADMERVDRELQKTYGWEKLPAYEIKKLDYKYKIEVIK